MNAIALEPLASAVQRNCHISDARHGGEYHMCTFLMKMREYFRWEKGLPYGQRLVKDEVGNWLADREALWESLENEDYQPLEIGGERVDPFDAEGVNLRLEPFGLVYSAGLGRNAKPHFFLGHLEKRRELGAYSVLVSDREYARDLGAPPAMNQGRVICLRRESLRRMLWEKLESWRWSRPSNPLGRAFACYDFENDLDGALDAMTEKETDAALLHEIGEFRAGRILGDQWNELLLEVSASPAELMARAVRDHLADCLVTLPALLDDGEEASIHFYLGNFTHMRQEIFPALERAYEDWMVSGSTESLHEIAQQGAEHWRQLALDLLDSRGKTPVATIERISGLVKANYL